jgi:Fe-S cluster assembly iron-binding protein IscA
MLTLTENASSLIKNLADQTAVAENAGLRISTTEGDAGLAVDLTPAPEPTDQVVESAGARVFLEPNAAVVLDDKVLDAQLDEGGSVTFAIGQQPG